MSSHVPSGRKSHAFRSTLTIALLGLSFQVVNAGAQPASAAAAQVGNAVSAAPPPELQAFAGNWRAKGSGTLRFFGFKVYDANLWLNNPAATFGFNNPFALDIRYDAGVKGADIVNTSLIEMTRISGGSAEQVAAWNTFMKSMFPDVKSGDRLVGVHLPASGARFFLNGALIGESADLAFSEAFFKIWLDPKTSRPELRLSLLGLEDPARRAPNSSP